MIDIDGARYDSWDDLPPQVRQLLEGRLPDSDGDGVPDLFAALGLPAGAVAPPGSVTTSTTIDVDGRTYDSMAALPLEVRRRVLESLRGPLETAARATEAAGGAPGETPRPAPPPAPTVPPRTAVPRPDAAAPGEMILNGVRVPTSGSTTPGLVEGSPRRGWLSRLLGR